MADDDIEELEDEVDELKEELREARAEDRSEDDDAERAGPPRGAPGAGAMMGGGGGNPFAQMMGGDRPGPGTDNSQELIREVRQLRDEVRDVNRKLEKIADSLTD